MQARHAPVKDLFEVEFRLSVHVRSNFLYCACRFLGVLLRAVFTAVKIFLARRNWSFSNRSVKARCFGLLRSIAVVLIKIAFALLLGVICLKGIIALNGFSWMHLSDELIAVLAAVVIGIALVAMKIRS